MILGIDASRNRSGGAIIHLLSFIENLNIIKHNLVEVHLWTYKDLLKAIPHKPWLKIHCPKELSGNIIKQLFWQKFCLPKEFNKNNCDIILNTDAGTISTITPNVTMSRDMLSYEIDEMKRYPIGLAWLRLLILRYVQNASLKKASGVIFLTNYASKTIQKYTGKLKNVAIISHGVGDNFRNFNMLHDNVNKKSKNLIYVSNVDAYKHQWNVVRAAYELREEGFNVNLTLIGKMDGKYKELLLKTVFEVDPHKKFINLMDFVPQKNLPNEIAKSDIFIFASSCENMPNTLIEGMAMGKTIACSNKGPMPEVLGDAGTYFNPSDIESIKNSLKKLLNDPEFCEICSQKAKLRSSKFSWVKCTDETINFLHQTMTLSEIQK